MLKYFVVICFWGEGDQVRIKFHCNLFGEKGVKLVPASGAPAILQKANDTKY